MKRQQIFEAAQQGQVMVGLCNMYPAAGIIEGMCRGWDFVWIDGQHGQMSYDAIANAIRAAAVVGVDTLVRVPSQEAGILGTHADLAPTALMVPMVDNVDQAEAIVQALRFPPDGTRSYGGRRAIDLAGRGYFETRTPGLVVQIETPEAVEQAAAIAAVDGVDALFFGPDDLKVRLRLPIDTVPVEHETLREMMATVAAAARGAGKLAACVAPTSGAVQAAHQMGYRLMVAGSDSGFVRSGAVNKLSEVRAASEHEMPMAVHPSR